MTIELKGVIQYWKDGKRCVDVVVTKDWSDMYATHRVGVDIAVNRGMILKFLATLYDVLPSAIGWPDHIRLKDEK